MHLNLAHFAANFIEQFPVSFCVYTKFYYRNSYHIIVFISQKRWYFMQINLW